MPLRGQGHSDLVRDETPYFRSLAELDTWFARPHDKLAGVLPYQPRPAVDGQSDSRGKLLICHDYKGGYTESPSELCYTFNFFCLCDTFVYFSHHRVGVPPSGWTNAAHKQGSKILGTLIFESPDAQSDCLQLLVGCASCAITDNKISVSKRYAVYLAELAHQRGFDGYLLNFESTLLYGTDQAHALATWILLLRAELRERVGIHAHVNWYDSVIYNGRRCYRNRLDACNLPFFLASDTFFTNYWWTPETQYLMTLYFARLDQTLSSNDSTDATSLVATKSLQSIYSGVDVWPGRGQYGDGGWCCYRSITYTNPLGFSTAIFAPGWTWESATNSPERNWNEWWDNEQRLWLGPLKPGEIIPVPDSPEGPFKPMNAFFHDLPHPNPAAFTFYTSFSPGVGYSWFVEGKKVLHTDHGWSDVDKQSSIGNLVWPWPTPIPEGVQQGAGPTTLAVIDMTDGYNGGNTLKLTVTYPGSGTDDTFRCIWLPVQSLALTTRKSFEACVVYKTTMDNDVDIDSRIYAKPLSSEECGSTEVVVGKVVVAQLPRGWTQEMIEFTVTSTRSTVFVAIGFLVGVILPSELSTKSSISLSLGQLAVYPTLPPSASASAPSVMGAKFAPTPHAMTPLEGVLTWDDASTFEPIVVELDDPESITPAWLLQDTPAYRFPRFVYFNVYVLPLDGGSVHVDPVFVGTTGLDGRANRFYVERACFPVDWDECVGVRFYVQGVTDRGEVLPWERCATVDHGRGAT